MKPKKDKLVALADALESCMDVRAELASQDLPYKEQEEKLRAEIVQELLSKGLQYVKTTSGLGFGMVRGRTTYDIRQGREQEAIKWALEQYPSLLTISKGDLGKVIKPMLNPPDFVEKKQGDPHLKVSTNEDEAPMLPNKES